MTLFALYVALISSVMCEVTEIPRFRILAPEFICPKDDGVIEKPDNTVITIQRDATSDLHLSWTVRWVALSAPTQRFTLLLWQAVRALENKLNKSQPEPYVYVINHDELLPGVDYVFNVSEIEENSLGVAKSFHIDNSQGQQELHIEGRSDMLSVLLVGGQTIYPDVEYFLEAQVTTCQPTQDYYFTWTVRSISTEDYVPIIQTNGSRLQVPANSVKPGLTYDANCQIIRQSNGHIITQTGLLFKVLNRGLEVHLSMDHLSVSVDEEFFIDSIVTNHDYFGHNVSYKWTCTFEEDSSVYYQAEDEVFVIATGLPKVGRYDVVLVVTVLDQTATANATVSTVDATLPIIQIYPLYPVVNEGSVVIITANASNVAPTCTLTWYFASAEVPTTEPNETCEKCQHGEPITDTITVYSLEENFLNELTDFTNDTEWREVTAKLPAANGRVRFVAECGCSIIFDCETKGEVYAQVVLKLNQSPKPGEVKITPESGSAMETVFRISTLAVIDPEAPLRYSFYTATGNESLLLGSFIEHLSVETFLPYLDGNTEVWVEVCDIKGACSTSDVTMVQIAAGEGRTLEAILDDVQAHVRRCELLLLERVAVSAIVTYTNAGQTDILSKFTTTLLDSLPGVSCETDYRYPEFLQRLAALGFDVGSLK